MDDFEKSTQYNQIVEILKDIQVNEQKEMKYAKKQSRFAIIISIVCLMVVVCVAFAVFTLLPKANALIGTTESIVTEAEGAVKNLNKITTELAEVDVDGLFDNVNGLVIQSQKDVTSAMEKLNAINFEKLNGAIEDLASIVDPLAKLLGGR